MSSQQEYHLSNNDRNALLVLLEADAKRAGFDNLVPTIEDCDRGCATTLQGTRGPFASCAFTDSLAVLSQATLGPSQHNLQGSTATTRRLSRIRDTSLADTAAGSLKSRPSKSPHLTRAKPR